jgi:SAM-dependent methyltransferase
VTSRYRYGDDPRRDVQPFVPGTARSLLDVGCGRGLFGAELLASRPELEVWGIDAAPAVGDDAGSRLSTFVLGLYPDDLPDRKFDCITFNDSLEHMIDPWEVLRSTAARLNHGGTLLVSLPNIRNYGIIRRLLVNGEWEYKDGGILDRTHLRFFTRRSAIRMFSDCGYTTEQAVALNVSTRGPASVVLRLLGSLTDEFRARQYLFVTTYTGPKSSPSPG